ncbi:MAG: hypothetical protein MI725_14310, partial [Pirellulales bacterium]|nr:hypothetical protein [Pirellulales bacterium]
MKRTIVLLLAACCVAILSSDVSAGVLFRDQMTDPNAWGTNAGSSDNNITFNYDYSADGIPEAPNVQGGDSATRGVKLEANLGGSAGGDFFTIYPLGQNFTGNYQLDFDMWLNYSTVDREDNGGAGTTEFGGGGIGYDGVTADIASGAQAIVTNEGGSSNDYRAFKSPPQFFIQDPAMACGSHNAGSCSTYLNQYPKGSGAPPVSQGQSPSDPNTNFNRAGSPGFQWFTWRFSVIGNTVNISQINKNGDRINIVEYDKTDTTDGS